MHDLLTWKKNSTLWNMTYQNLVKKNKNTFLKHAKLIVLAFVFCLSRIKSLRESAAFLS